MEYKYIIPNIPPSNNKFIGRSNKWEYQKIKKEWANLIWLTCRPKPKQPLSGVTVSLKYYFKDKIRRDPDNFSGKMILDGLVKARILQDDSFDCITLKLDAGYDKNNPRTEITIGRKSCEQEEEK